MKFPDVLLFDLGGVLVEFSGIACLRALLPSPTNDAAIRERLTGCQLLRQFEVGALEPMDFAKAFVADWRLGVPPADFLLEFRDWSRGLLPGARALLDTLRPRYRVAALSNSNAVHWDRNTSDLGITALFEPALSSHQLKCHKPDPAIYLKTLECLAVPADRVAFFDDFEPNVEGARAVGIRSFHVQGVTQLAECLRRHGFMPDDAV